MKRNAFVIYVDEDPTGGPFGDLETTRISLQGILVNRVPHYHPLVEVATTTEPAPIQWPTNPEGNTEA